MAGLKIERILKMEGSLIKASFKQLYTVVVKFYDYSRVSEREFDKYQSKIVLPESKGPETN